MTGLSPERLEALERELDIAAGAGLDAARPRARRRAAGAYFTPDPVVSLIAAEVVRARMAAPVGWRADGSPRLTVLDPSCGDGRFLRAVGEVLVAHAAGRGADPGRARAAIARRCLIGIERDEAFAAQARRDTGATVHCCEALLDGPALSPVDIVVGNPPYQRSVHLARADAPLWSALRGRYAATSHGEWDLYAAFVEQTLGWLAPGGHAGLVVPSRWMTAAFAGRLRDKLARAGAVRAVVDFGAAQLFPGATTYVSLLFLTRAAPGAVSGAVTVARKDRAGWQLGQVPRGSLDERPWRLSIGRRRAQLERLSARGMALGEVARIAKGAGTNADAAYLIHEARVVRGRVVGRSRETGGEVAVERALARACARGRDVVAGGHIDGTLRCIVPYDGRGRLYEPDELRQWPAVWAHLQRVRGRLEAREGGRYRDERFYRFGRPQNLAYHFDRAPKVVVPDVARAGRALIDEGGALILDSAYAVRPAPGSPYSPAQLAAVLGSPIVALWLRETGIPLRGGYLRLKTAYLRSLPLPPPDALGPAPTEAQLRLAYGLDEDDWLADER